MIIDEADTMTVAAQNALLKTLEEPLGEALLILLAEDRSRLLPTIVSRSVPITLARVATAEIATALSARGYAAQVAEAAARRSLGCPGAALRLADADSLMAANQQAAKAAAFVRAPKHERIKTIAALVKGDDAQTAEGLQVWLLDVCGVLHESLLASSSASDALSLAAVLEASEALRDNGNPALALERIALALP
jgi:DNA polymerase-3 subunit delta'